MFWGFVLGLFFVGGFFFSFTVSLKLPGWEEPTENPQTFFFSTFTTGFPKTLTATPNLVRLERLKSSQPKGSPFETAPFRSSSEVATHRAGLPCLALPFGDSLCSTFSSQGLLKCVVTPQGYQTAAVSLLTTGKIPERDTGTLLLSLVTMSINLSLTQTVVCWQQPLLYPTRHLLSLLVWVFEAKHNKCFATSMHSWSLPPFISLLVHSQIH